MHFKSFILLWNRVACGILFLDHAEGGELTMTREEAERELCRLLEEAEADIQAGRTVPAEEVFA